MITFKATGYQDNGSTFNILATPSRECCGEVTQLCNGQAVRLITCATFPAITQLLPVYLQLGTTTFPILDPLGNTLMTDQIKSRRCYQLVFGTNDAHFLMKSCVSTSQAAQGCEGV